MFDLDFSWITFSAERPQDVFGKMAQAYRTLYLVLKRLIMASTPHASLSETRNEYEGLCA